jgi:transposase-like protein
MQYTTSGALCATVQVLPARIHALAVLCFVALALLGICLEVSGGWLVWPPVIYSPHASWRHRAAPRNQGGADTLAAWWYIAHTWPQPFLQGLLLQLLWLAHGHVGPSWGVLVPWLAWACSLSGLVWPSLTRHPEWWLVQRLATRVRTTPLWLAIGLALDHRTGLLAGQPGYLAVGLVTAQSTVTVRHDSEDRCYRAEFSGRFTLTMADDDPLRLRLFILAVRSLDDDSAQRGSRRTREGRTPAVRQQMLAESLGIPQPDISRWERYWQERDWRRLLSLHSPDVLTHELVETIITTWAHHPQWSCERVYHLLIEHGVAVSRSQVEQAAQESGWQIVRQTLGRLCTGQAETLRLREDWLVGDLLAQIQVLLDKVETKQGLTPQEMRDVAACQAATAADGLAPRVPVLLRPWLRRVEQVLFRPWAETMVGDVCCTYCGSADVGRKSRIPRFKRVIDAAGEVHWVAVYRYYCHNGACAKKSFTALPPGALPYTAHDVETHVLVLQMYAWGRSVYRRTGEAVGVATMTTYRWVSAFGAELLPVAALFGVVKSSGVVGVDEKYVLVPKNGKAAGDNRRWMYVYLAVDCYTYDLLHIAIYEHNTKESAQAFLLALRAKGYHLRVVVTDLRQDYGPALAAVFPAAQHHECLFHAGKALHRQLWVIYGRERYRHDQQVVALREALDGVLAAETKRTAQRRYDAVMAQREALVASERGLESVFATLAAHWPMLINGIESDLIPRTNNTVELVIRRFDQHYQNMCGFESVQTASVFLGVFEKVYRFTPFSQDAQPRLRGKSPLEVAGYDVAQMPMTSACRGWALSLPFQPPAEVVPNG